MRRKRSHALPFRQPAYLSKFDSIFSIAALVVLLVLFFHAACHASAIDINRTIANKSLTMSQFVDGIVTRSAELNYITEQDSEVFAFYRNTTVKENTDSVFLSLLRRPAETQIIQQQWFDFFQARRRNDSAAKWKELQDYLEAHLTNLTVYRMPRDGPYGAQYDLYAVGIFNNEKIVGVQMFGVAT